MLPVQLSIFSPWSLILASVPLAVVLLAVLSFLPQHGKLYDFVERCVRKLLFAPLPFAPGFVFIQLLLGLLALVTLTSGLTVASDSARVLPASTPLDKQLLTQGRQWRNQRNLYLTALALTLWYSVYMVYTLRAQLARAMRDAGEQDEGMASAASSTERRGVAAKNVVEKEHETGKPTARRIPQSSAPSPNE